ncbi:hypothetical protein FQA39_LY16161 [Lamprigera yunnana]|nr:hypothetical protein FQA39_LY16161 [Lamprigera yunnana]
MTESITRIESGNEIDSLLNKHFLTKIRSGFVEVGENKFCLPVSYEKFRDDLENFEVRDSDVYLIAHPKTGTTWVQEMVWLIVNDLNYEGAKEPNYVRFPNLDAAMYTENKLHLDINYMDKLNQIPAPRFLRCHLPWSLLPKQIRNGTKKPKIISTVRSAEDVCVSYYHHCKLVEGYTGSFDEFCQLFIAGRVVPGRRVCMENFDPEPENRETDPDDTDPVASSSRVQRDGTLSEEEISETEEANTRQEM